MNNFTFNVKPNRIALAVIIAGLLAVSGCTVTDITSSTSSTLDTVTPDVTLNRFVDVRIATIQKEAAEGKGESLDALAQLMGRQDKTAFSGWMKQNYHALFGNLEKPDELVTRIEILSGRTRG